MHYCCGPHVNVAKKDYEAKADRQGTLLFLI